MTAEDCAAYCLAEDTFVCRSFEFREEWYYDDRRCILSDQSLYTLDLYRDPLRGPAIDLFTRIDTGLLYYFAIVQYLKLMYQKTNKQTNKQTDKQNKNKHKQLCVVSLTFMYELMRNLNYLKLKKVFKQMVE